MAINSYSLTSFSFPSVLKFKEPKKPPPKNPETNKKNNQTLTLLRNWNMPREGSPC